nr:MotA/TolQ/ExbB proton channel family protein [Desulfobulbaceae bacterium]
MRHKNTIGLALCLLLFILGFVIHGNIGLFFNIAGMLIVTGGTFGAALVSYRFERLAIVAKVVYFSYKNSPKTPEEIIDILVNLVVKSRYQGILSLQEEEDETTISFLRNALGMLVDGHSPQMIKEVLSTEMFFFRTRRHETEMILRGIADYAPSFGLVGSVVGLIGMLSGVGNTAVVLQMVPIALTSTLYGIILANFIFIPFAANLQERTYHELLLQKIILDGILAIESEMNPRLLEKKLKFFLTPSARKGKKVSLRKIQERFKIKKDKH